MSLPDLLREELTVKNTDLERMQACEKYGWTEDRLVSEISQLRISKRDVGHIDGVNPAIYEAKEDNDGSIKRFNRLLNNYLALTTIEDALDSRRK